MHNQFKAVNVKVTALFYHDESQGEFVVFTAEKGGPVIREKSLGRAKVKFERYLQIGGAARNLLFYANAIRSSSKKKRREYARKFAERVGNVEYIEIPHAA